MLSSYTLLSRAPAPAPAELAPGRKFSPAGALQLRKQPPPPPAAVVAVPWASGKESRSRRRAPVFVCHAAKYDYKDIQPSALKTPALARDDCTIMEDKDRLIILKLKVGESTSKDQLKVETTDDLELLVIKYTGDVNDDSPASSLDLRLLVPSRLRRQEGEG
ncbi:uncharacterized protein [Miscanthus floridulus]|uniref:uncharacterized protein n=1 Tax=Miscanthus floridulus TaxID=154761 RepID=UPI003459CD96